MRVLPVRPNIYLPVVRLGVADSDWFTLLMISCAGYLVPVPFGITILYVPLQLWTWLLATTGSIAFFNYIRIGRKPYWLQHKLKSLCFHHRQYRAIPNGTKRPFIRPWSIGGDCDKAELYRTPPNRRTRQTASLLEENHRIQEEGQDRCKNLSLTTN
jgi:hypothetical protein